MDTQVPQVPLGIVIVTLTLLKGLNVFKVIQIDFEVYRALTSYLASETSSFNDALREKLNLPPKPAFAPAAIGDGWTRHGVTLPNGTKLRAKYDEEVLTATIINGQWVRKYEPFELGFSITETGGSGWSIWMAKRPGDTEWTPLVHFLIAPDNDWAGIE